MPNWTMNKLTFILPSENKDAFLAAIEGPADWALPIEAFGEFERPKAEVSNHLRIKIEQIGVDNQDIIAEFKAHMKQYGWPEWMKPSLTDIELFMTDPDKLKGEIEPFSVAAIAPWEGPEEFESLFPDTNPNGVMWVPGPRDNGFSSPIIALRNKKIGPKWPPSDIQMDVEDDVEKTRIEIKFSTPWSPMDDVATLLNKVCTDHKAKFLLTWVEEQGLCGYTYHDPMSGNEPEDVDYGFDHNWNHEVEDADDPEDKWTEFDQAAFEEDVAEWIDDPDFS
jgi:hypothetical protein